jgi:hypothetical protein
MLACCESPRLPLAAGLYRDEAFSSVYGGGPGSSKELEALRLAYGECYSHGRASEGLQCSAEAVHRGPGQFMHLQVYCRLGDPAGLQEGRQRRSSSTGGVSSDAGPPSTPSTLPSSQASSQGGASEVPSEAASSAQEDPAAAACPSTYEEVRQRLFGGASSRAARPCREGKTTTPAHLPAPACCAELNRESPWLRVIYVADNRELCMRLVPGAIYAAEEFLDRVAAVG